MGKAIYPLGARGNLDGGPYQGSHAKAYNASRGSDNWESENAVDIAVPTGTPVYAVQDGTIGSQIGSLNSKDPQMAGQRLHLVTKTNEFYYAHLSQLAVKAGQRVKAGQLIGYSGAANGVQHLHFAVRKGDPTKVLNGEIPEGSAPPTTSDQGAPTTDANSTPQPVVPSPTGYVGPEGSALERPYMDRADYSLPAQGHADTWQMIAQQPGGVSPDTLRYADLSTLANGTSPQQ